MKYSLLEYGKNSLRGKCLHSGNSRLTVIYCYINLIAASRWKAFYYTFYHHRFLFHLLFTSFNDFSIIALAVFSPLVFYS